MPVQQSQRGAGCSKKFREDASVRQHGRAQQSRPEAAGRNAEPTPEEKAAKVAKAKARMTLLSKATQQGVCFQFLMKACKATGNDCRNGKHTVRGTRAARTHLKPLPRAREIALLQEERRKARAVAQKKSMRKNGATPIESPRAHRKWSETGENKKGQKKPKCGKTHTSETSEH